MLNYSLRKSLFNRKLCNAIRFRSIFCISSVKDLTNGKHQEGDQINVKVGNIYYYYFINLV